MKLKNGIVFLFVLTVLCLPSMAQEKKKEEPDYPLSKYKPLKVNISEDGTKYIRFILWHQIWAEDQDLSTDPGFTMKLRRSRFLAYAQISERFLILTHFGLNNLSSTTADPLGNGASIDPTINGPQLFMHGAWTEFRVTNSEAIYLGAGLHYWNGLSRLTNASTLNFMTLDNYRQAWAQLGLSDQFARHLGIYAKGKFGKFKYQLSINDPIANALGSTDVANLKEDTLSYSGRRVFETGSRQLIQGYFEFQFFDTESNKLPYRVGSYLGKKKVLNLGAGFISHPKGTAKLENGNPVGENVNHFAVDVFYDTPLGKGGLNAYLAYYNFNYGNNYALETTYGTGSSIYGHVGYLLPFNSNAGRVMPYLAYSTRDYEAFQNPGNLFQAGINWFINGHNAKVTLEYRTTQANYTGTRPDRVNGLILQTHIFL